MGPLTESSAFSFENFYSELRNAFTPGTNAPLKQMLKSIILRRALSHHACYKSIHYSAQDTPMECNSLIYTFKNNVHNFYVIKSVHASHVICYQQGKFPLSYPDTNLQWNKVGVYRRGSLSNIPLKIDFKDIMGKVLNVDNVLLTCPKNVLQEQ